MEVQTRYHKNHIRLEKVPRREDARVLHWAMYHPRHLARGPGRMPSMHPSFWVLEDKRAIEAKSQSQSQEQRARSPVCTGAHACHVVYLRLS